MNRSRFPPGRSEERGDLVHGRALSPDSKPWKEKLDQQQCTFVPHVLVAPLGATVEVVNNDKALHQVKAQAGDFRLMNYAMPVPATWSDEADQGGRLQGELRRASMDAGLAPGAAYQRLRSDRPRRYVPGRRRSAGKAQGEVLARAAR